MRILSSPIHLVNLSIRTGRFQLLAAASAIVVSLLLMIPIFVARRSSAHGVGFANKKQQGCCANQPAILRRMIGTYYTTEDGFKSTLVLNNKGPNQIVVTPILHSQAGQTFTASLVVVGDQSSLEVDLNLLASIAGQQFRSGSFEFTYEGRLLEMGGGLRIVNAEKSLIFDEQMLEPGMKFPSSQLEAVYAVPFEDSQVSVIVTNTTAQPVNVDGDAIFAGTNGHHPVKGNLGPYETKIVNLPHGLVKKASAGAVSLSHNGGKGALLAMIHVQDSGKGYSEAVNFTDPAGGKTAELHGAGLRLGKINNDSLNPVVAVRNLGAGATTVIATVPYSKQNGATGTIALPQISLAPGAIKLLNMSNPQLKQNDFATAGLEIKYTGAPGSVIASASSVSQSGNHVFPVPLLDLAAQLSSTGGYPWFINSATSTVVFIKNATDQPQEYHYEVIFPGGRWGGNLHRIEPHQTHAIDLRQIRDSQSAGVEGGTLPPDATVGHIEWSVRGATPKPLIGRAQTFDSANGLASSYMCQLGCACPTNFYDSRVNPNTVTGLLGAIRNFVAQERGINCYGTIGSYFDTGAYYGSSNTGVVTINSSTGSSEAVGVGNTTIDAAFTGYTYNYDAALGCLAFPVNTDPTASYAVEQLCNDTRDTIRIEYQTYNVAFLPVCEDFTQDAHSAHFAFNELNSGDYNWAIIRNVLLTGLENTRTNYFDLPLIINSGYRNPARNSVAGGAINSRHVYGDAADIASNQSDWQGKSTAARLAGACIEPVEQSGFGHVHADWRGPCPAGW
ncbi:MAG: D-Ala-D-Ala carboxypeptidase family metallohydrolase [Blastocatellales bacterium]